MFWTKIDPGSRCDMIMPCEEVESDAHFEIAKFWRTKDR